MRAVLLTFSLLPYLYYGVKDNAYHFRGRVVSKTEHMLHLAIGITLIAAIANAYTGRQAILILGLVIFGVAGAIDEYIYHRGIPAEESDLHAKEHLGLLLFVVVSLATDWLEKNNWQLQKLL